MMTREEAVKELVECDHAFLTPEGARELAAPFGLIPAMHKVQDRRSEFKGLYVPSVKEGDWVEGIEAHILAMQICDKLGLKYGDYFGIGSQLRECCRVIQESL